MLAKSHKIADGNKAVKEARAANLAELTALETAKGVRIT